MSVFAGVHLSVTVHRSAPSARKKLTWLLLVRCLPEMPWESFRDLTPFQLKNHVRQMIQDEVSRMRTLA